MSNPSSLNRLFEKLGAKGFDEVAAEICKGCTLQEACGKSSAKCNSLNVIFTMGVDVVCDRAANLIAPEFLERLKKVVEVLKWERG